jgi:hypothetical protein
MADRVSARRSLANTFFLTISTAVIAGLVQHNAWPLAAAGVGPGVVHEVCRPSHDGTSTSGARLRDEWEGLKPPMTVNHGKYHARLFVARYRELGHVDLAAPWIFGALYFVGINRGVT